MTCKNCGNILPDDANFCTVCGAKAEIEEPAMETVPLEETPAYAEPAVQSEPTYAPPAFSSQSEPAPTQVQSSIPEQYEPLSPWAYWGYTLLFSVPIVGFIFLIIFSCKDSNLNRRNYARSYWCNLIIVGIALVALILIAILGGLGAAGVNAAIRY